jgi:beta-ribofuranosylaminobenzene 5'-phosphate synthase
MKTFDLFTLKAALAEICSLGFKRREIQRHGSVVNDLISVLNREYGLPCGMSSLGPLIYCIFDPGMTDIQNIAARVKNMCAVQHVLISNTTNHGYSISD